MFSNRQIKILKTLKNKQLSFDELSIMLNVDIDSLYELIGGEFDSYIKPAYPSKNKITISEKGSAFLDEIHKSNIRFWIPVAISILALICSIVGWFLPL